MTENGGRRALPFSSGPPPCCSPLTWGFEDLAGGAGHTIYSEHRYEPVAVVGRVRNWAAESSTCRLACL